MCGIAGIFGAGHKDLIYKLTDALYHRGPDSSGVFHSDIDSLSMGMSRLSIIDYEGGYQPMSTSDASYTLVYNGEIFNSLSLRQKYLSDYKFKSDHSDTETLLAFASRLSLREALGALNGMFAFALFDKANAKLYLAVDRFWN